MTSKTSSSKFGKLVMHRFKQLAWLTTLWSAALFFALPVLQSMQLGLLMPNGGNYLDKFEANQLLADSNYLVMVGVLVTGIVAACVVQAYMNSKLQNDLWLSLPVRREKLFAANLTAGAMAVLVPLTSAYIVTSILTVLTPNAGREMLDIGLVLSGYLRAAGLFLVAYAITTLWCVLSGRTIIAVLCTLFTPAIGSGLVGLTVILFLMEFKTFYFSDQIVKALIALCPFAPFFVTTISGNLMKIMDIVWAAVAVGLLFLSVRLFQKRSPEKAGNALAYPKALPVVKYPLVFISMVVGWMFFKLATGATEWAIFGAVAIGLFIFCLVNVLEKFDFRNILHHWWKYVATLAVFGLCICVFVLDPFSYDTYLPAREKVTEVKVYALNLNKVDLNPADYQQTISDPEIIDSLYNLSKLLVSPDINLNYVNRLGSYNNFSDNNYDGKFLYYVVDYNGFTRQYSAYVSEDQAEFLFAIFSNPKVIINTSKAYTFVPNEIELMTLEFTNMSLSYTVDATEATGPENGGLIGEFIYALRSDVLLSDAKKLGDANLLCVLHLKGENKDGLFTVDVPVYDFFEEIRETWLWSVIENHTMKTDPTLIESIKIERLSDKYSKTITDPAEIAEFIPALITYMDPDYNPLVSIENDFTVTVVYKDGSVVYPGVCTERKPDWLPD